MDLYSTILFDIDGVLLSEERYFDASALTVYEMIVSKRFLGLTIRELPPYQARPAEDTINQIRQAVFDGDRVLEFMKSRGINANWDMVYLQFVTQFLSMVEDAQRHAAQGSQTQHTQAAGGNLDDDANREPEPFARISRDYGAAESWTASSLQEVGQLLAQANVQPQFEVLTRRFEGCKDKQTLFAAVESWYQAIFPKVADVEATLRTLWDLGQVAFQEWYLGKKYLPQQPEDKAGFVINEIPLAPPVEIGRLMEACLQQGIRIGVATGRPAIETKVPFETYGWLKFFDPLRITTASDVLEAEQTHPSYRPLSKPNPFCYLRSYYDSPPTLEVIGTALPLSEEDCANLLIVGDSVADLLAAHSIGCKFAAVLTGLSGEAARAQFEELNADYIWSDVTGLWSLLKA